MERREGVRLSQHGEAAGNLTGPLVESVTSSILAFIPFVFLLSMLGMALASIARVNGSEAGGILDAILEWAGSLRSESVGESAAMEEWRPYLAAGGVVVVAGGLFALLILSDIL